MSLQNQIETLGAEFWTWRTRQQPRSHDDIPRIEREHNWLPAWSPSDVAQYRQVIAEFNDRYTALEESVSVLKDKDPELYVDYRLIGSAIARVIWELDYLLVWQEQPRFYIDQTIGVVFDLLTVPNVDHLRVNEVTHILNNTATILQSGRENLAGNLVGEYVEVAIELLGNIEVQISTLVTELAKCVDSDSAEQLQSAGDSSAQAFVSFRDWLIANRVAAKPFKPVGRENYRWFLHNVALLPFEPEEIISIGELEWERAVTLEHITTNRYRAEPMPPIPSSAPEQVENERNAELQVREFYESEGILSQPESLGHYLNDSLPAYLEPIRWLGVTDDLTGPSRVDEDGVSYVPDPRPDLPYFYAANARDTRAGIVHEGAHYQQLALSWRNSRILRRYYYDSGVNEGIAFYNEELMLAAGLFHDAPQSQVVMYNFMKLRALRVIVDVKLAIGAIDAAQATEYLEKKVPMDHETAYEEAVFFASSPGQALTYQIGKTQIIRLFSDSIEARRSSFNMKDFHDYLWTNGNVPISLLRFEMLNDSSDLDRLNL